MAILNSGIYKITFDLNAGQHALDVDQCNTIIICPSEDKNSQLWCVDYHNEMGYSRIWNLDNNGMFLCAKEMKEGSQLVLKDKPEIGNWATKQFDNGHLISPDQKELVIMIDADPQPNRNCSVCLALLHLNGSVPSKWTKWVFVKNKYSESEVTDTTSKLTSDGSFPGFDDQSVLVNHSSGLFKISPKNHKQYFLGAIDNLSGLNKLCVMIDGLEVSSAEWWYVKYNLERRCFTIQRASENGPYICWTKLSTFSDLILGNTRCYWEICREGEDNISIRFPKSMLSIRLAGQPDNICWRPAISGLLGVTLQPANSRDANQKWVVGEVKSEALDTIVLTEMAEK